MSLITLHETLQNFFNIPIIKFATIAVYLILLIACTLAVIHDITKKGEK